MATADTIDVEQNSNTHQHEETELQPLKAGGSGGGCMKAVAADAAAAAADKKGHRPALQHQPLSVQVSFSQDTRQQEDDSGGGDDNWPATPAASARHFSFGARTYSDVTGMTAARHGIAGHRSANSSKLSRQKTMSGDSALSTKSASSAQQAFCRAISRTYTLTSTSSVATEEWRPIFDKLLEGEGAAGGGGAGCSSHKNGKIPLDKFKEILDNDVLWSETIPPEVQDRILANVDKNGDSALDYEEFLELVRGRNHGFGRRQRHVFRLLLKQAIEILVPNKYVYQNQYSCSPPPLFLLTISLLQAVIFTYNCVIFYQVEGSVGLDGPVPHCSALIFNPNKRYQVWRYLTYMFIHSGVFHAVFNILVQLVLGIPLEMVHGWWRVMLVYVFGVIAGSLWTNVMRPNVFLSGASGGVYALITAHLGTVIMNFKEMAYPWCRVLFVSFVAITDVGVYLYNVYIKDVASIEEQPVSYAAHLSGALTGLLVGITCLKNLRWERHERYIWAISALVFLLLIGSAIVWSIADKQRFTGIPSTVKIDCISDKLL